MQQLARLIAFSGIDGSGKSTQVQLLVQWLNQCSCDAVAAKTNLSATHSLFSLAKRLYGDGFAYHPNIPATLREFVVCCDVLRYSETVLRCLRVRRSAVVWDRGPLCHEAYARSYGAEMTWILNLLAGVERPDLTVLLDLDPAVALRRISGRTEQPRQSNETYDFLSRVRQTYLDLARDQPSIVVIDAAKPTTSVERSVRSAVKRSIHCDQ
jgi:dTMP kinase